MATTQPHHITMATLPVAAILFVSVMRGVSGVEQNPGKAPDDITAQTTAAAKTQPITVGEDPSAYCSSLAEHIGPGVVWSHDANVTRFSVGETITLSCENASHTLQSPASITCLDPGMWDFEGNVTCQYTVCTSPSGPTHGSVRLSTTGPLLPDTKAQYSCHHGYELVGQQQLSCMKSGQWTDVAPNCQVSCPARQLTSGSLGITCHYEGCVAMVTCDEGYRVRGNSSVTCNHTGDWTAVEWPRCTLVTCGPPPAIPGTTHTSSPLPSDHQTYIYSTAVVYVCHGGATLVGGDTLTCGGDGRWNGTGPECNVTDNATKPSPPPPAPCPSPDTVPHASYSVHNRTVTYTCDHGYHLHGDQLRVCEAGGDWSGSSPSCLSSSSPHHHWRQVFQTHKEWQGRYLFRDNEVGFRFWYLSATPHSIEGLLLDDMNAKLHLKGSSADSVVVFQTERLLVPSAFIRDVSWRVRGELTNVSGGLSGGPSRGPRGWVFSGIVHSSERGFSNLHMAPVLPAAYSAPPLPAASQYASATALALGVAIAVVAIVVAAVLAAYCVKTKGGFKGSTGHRTLTSFENPVYEYEGAQGGSN